MHPWRMEVCPIKYAQCGMMTKSKHTVASSSVCKKENCHCTMQLVCDMWQCQLKCGSKVLSPVAWQWSWVSNGPHSGKSKPTHARNYYCNHSFLSYLFFFSPNNKTRSLRILGRNSCWKCRQLTDFPLYYRFNINEIKQKIQKQSQKKNHRKRYI